MRIKVPMQESRAELEAAKEQKFRALIRHAHTHSPYYANIMRERGLDVNTCTAVDFPELTKAILMANFNDIVTDPRVTKQVIADFLSRSTDPKERLFDDITVMHTSGTSGEVGYFVYAPADFARLRGAALRNRAAFRGLLPGFGRRLRRLRLGFYGATGGHFAGVTGMASMQQGMRRLFVDARVIRGQHAACRSSSRINAIRTGRSLGLHDRAEDARRRTAGGQAEYRA